MGCSQGPSAPEGGEASGGDESALVGTVSGNQRRLLTVLRSTTKPSENCVYELSWTREGSASQSYAASLLNPESVTVSDVAGSELPLGSFAVVGGIASLPFTAAFCLASFGGGCFALAGSIALVGAGATTEKNAIEAADQVLDSSRVYPVQTSDYARMRARVVSIQRVPGDALTCAPWLSYKAADRKVIFSAAIKSMK